MNTELILPGGDLERVKIAFAYGADAVYVGLNKHSLRKAEVRFDIPEIGKAIEHAHSLGKRLFVTFNIFAHNEHLADIERDMTKIAKFSPDAFIIADIGVMQIAKRVAPKVPIHVSTQANTVNIEDVKFWASQGVKRVVLARELTLPEIKAIHDAVPKIELEVFVHGAMCISYSGRCLMSNYMTGRDANLGECAQPCRWNYRAKMTNDEFLKSNQTPNLKLENSEIDSKLEIRNSTFTLEEAKRPGEYFVAEESTEGTTIMSSKDLRLVRYLPEILETGVVGLKIEGRNKSEYYLATTARAYREALDLTNTGKYTEKDKKRLESELEKLNYRGYTTGFVFGDAKKGETYDKREPIREWDYVGKITNNKLQITNKYEIVVNNKITDGDKIEALTPTGVFKDEILSLTDTNGNELNEISAGTTGQRAIVELQNEYPVDSFLRRKL